ANEGVVNQSILNVNENAHRSIHSGKFFYSENRGEEAASSSSVLFRCFNRHQAEVETVFDYRRVELLVFVHFFNTRTDFALGKLANACSKHLFIFRECSKWST